MQIEAAMNLTRTTHLVIVTCLLLVFDPMFPVMLLFYR